VWAVRRAACRAVRRAAPRPDRGERRAVPGGHPLVPVGARNGQRAGGKVRRPGASPALARVYGPGESFRPIVWPLAAVAGTIGVGPAPVPFPFPFPFP